MLFDRDLEIPMLLVVAASLYPKVTSASGLACIGGVRLRSGLTSAGETRSARRRATDGAISSVSGLAVAGRSAID